MKNIFRMHRVHRDERGITGLETAIILIAFIVVASVFAYTVLSAGLFSSQKAEETIHSGIETGQSTVELSGGNVIAYKGTADGDECITKLSFSISPALESGQYIDLTPFYYIDSTGSLTSPMIADCNSAWTAGTNVTAGLDSADYKENKRSVKLVVDDAFATDNIAAYYATPSTLDLTAANQVALWVKSSAAQVAGSLQLHLCTDALGATPIDNGGDEEGILSIPALSTNEWKQVFINLDEPEALTGINSIALYAEEDPGAVEIRLDEVMITLVPGSTSRNITMVAYSDSNIVIDDVAWTVEFVGGYEASGNYLLENTEKAFITVWLQNYIVDPVTGIGAYYNGTGSEDPFIDDNEEHLGTNDEFYVQIMPPKGATLLVEKRTPPYLDPIMRIY